LTKLREFVSGEAGLIKTQKHANDLDEDLNTYNPKQWGINLPIRDYRLRYEDLIPALAGASGYNQKSGRSIAGWCSDCCSMA